MPEPIPYLTITEARAALAAGRLGPAQLVQACRAQADRLDPLLNAFITRTDPGQGEAAGASGPLGGIPIAVKDLFDVAGVPTTAGSPLFAERVAERDAHAVARLRGAGAMIVGKTNTHEIALGVTNVNPHFGPCRNPWDPARISGGSSGGSAAAVAAGMCLAALGTDTGGSIRIPASLCGVVGLKPTYGRVSLRGVQPLSWNLDHAGPLARTARDAALLLGVLAGYDPADPASQDRPVDDYPGALGGGVDGWRLALVTGAYTAACDAEVWEAVRVAAGVLRGLGARVDELALDWLVEAAAANGLMTQADAAAVHRERLQAQPERFGADVRERLLAGRDTACSEYVRARRTQAEARRRLEGVFESYDALLLPATPVAALEIEAIENSARQAPALTRFTAPFNLTGLPALSVPCGFTAQGLPVGLQIACGPWGEARLLRAGVAYQEATDWHARRLEPAPSR